jgi:hypothetical protein
VDPTSPRVSFRFLITEDHIMRTRALAIALLTAGLFAPPALADNENRFAIDFGLGYSKLNIDGDVTEELDGEETIAPMVRFTFLPPENSGWRIGFSLQGTTVYDETGPFVYDGELFVDDPFKQFSMLVPMFQLGYQFDLGNTGVFITPRIGVGPSFGYFVAGEEYEDWWDDDNEYEQRYKVGFAVQPAIQIGYAWSDHFAAGAEAAYLWTHLDFGDGAGGDVTNFYAGGFFRWSF